MCSSEAIKGANKSTEKKLRRMEALEKARLLENILSSANSAPDPIHGFEAFKKFERNGLTLFLENAAGTSLAPSVRKYMMQLLKVNMEPYHGEAWVAEEKKKRKELVDRDARYLLIYQTAESNLAPSAKLNEESLPSICGGKHEIESCSLHVDTQNINTDTLDIKRFPVGFVQFRFVDEEGAPVLYVYELQLEKRICGKGLGRFLMQLLELVARKNKMVGIVLTVEKLNKGAFAFYTEKLKYKISPTSPSRVDPLGEDNYSYEILCKMFG